MTPGCPIAPDDPLTPAGSPSAQYRMTLQDLQNLPESQLRHILRQLPQLNGTDGSTASCSSPPERKSPKTPKWKLKATPTEYKFIEYGNFVDKFVSQRCKRQLDSVYDKLKDLTGGVAEEFASNLGTKYFASCLMGF